MGRVRPPHPVVSSSTSFDSSASQMSSTSSPSLRPIGPALVDTHVHYWDHSVPEVNWDWLRPGYQDGVAYPVIGSVDAIKAARYGAADFLAEVAGLGVCKVVHVEAAERSSDAIAETRWLEHEADSTGFPNAIVGAANLMDPDLASVLDAHALASGRFRGVRDLEAEGKLGNSGFARGYAEVGAHGLIVDINCTWQNMRGLRHVALKHPDVIAVLDHGGYPTDRTPAYFHSWQAALLALADAPNVHCKLSGFGMGDHNWTAASLEPWLMHCLDAFGVTRCMFGSNWPIDRMWSSYATLLEAYGTLFAGFQGGETAALFSGNAERLFAI